MKRFILILPLACLLSCEISINKNHTAEGMKLMSEGDYFNADLEFDDALFSDKDNLDALRGSFQCAMNLGMTDKALTRVNSIIALNPDSAVGYNDRGTFYLLTKDYSKALSDFNEVLAKGTDYPTVAYFNRGESLRLQNRFEEAIKDYNMVLAADNKDARAYYKKGLAFSKTGNKDSSCTANSIAKDLGDKDAVIEFNANCK